VSKFCFTVLKSVEEEEEMAADFASEEEYAFPPPGPGSVCVLPTL
jgi:hypothetical protein